MDGLKNFISWGFRELGIFYSWFGDLMATVIICIVAGYILYDVFTHITVAILAGAAVIAFAILSRR